MISIQSYLNSIEPMNGNITPPPPETERAGKGWFFALSREDKKTNNNLLHFRPERYRARWRGGWKGAKCKRRVKFWHNHGKGGCEVKIVQISVVSIFGRENCCEVVYEKQEAWKTNLDLHLVL